MGDKTKIIIAILIAVIVILASVVVYAFVIRPGITGYAVGKQVEGYDFAIAQILQVVAQCQTFPVPIGENQTINLVALECLQAPSEVQQQQPIE